MHQSHAQTLLRGVKRGEHNPRKELVSEARQSRAEPQRDVHRMPRLQQRPAQVRHPGLLATWLSTCAHSSSAPRAKRERKLNRSLNPDYPRTACYALTPHELDLAYLVCRCEGRCCRASLCRRFGRKRLAVRETGDPELRIWAFVLWRHVLFGPILMRAAVEHARTGINNHTPPSRREARDHSNKSHPSLTKVPVLPCACKWRPAEDAICKASEKSDNGY